MALDQMELRTKEGMQEIQHNLQRAINEIEQKEARKEHSVKLEQLDRTMRILLFEQMDVAEVCSRPRIAKVAHQMGMRAGWSLDFTTCNETDKPWDSNCLKMRNEVVRKLFVDKPRLLIGRPMCGPFGSMNNLNYARMIEEEKQTKLAYGRKHVEFCCKLHGIQWREGRYFIHEHPESASSWQEDCVKCRGDQCRYGLTSYDGRREGPARQSIGFLMGSPCIAERLSLRCPNTTTNKVHDHVILRNGRATAAEVYPPGLCRAVCQGLIEYNEVHKLWQFSIAGVDKDGKGDGHLMNKGAKQLKEQSQTVEGNNGDELELAWDDVSGASLDPSAVRRARAEEVEYVRTMKLYTKVPIDECYTKTGKGSTIVRWIDINKGDSLNPNYRSRLVLREINTSKMDDLFAGTPPSEALKMIISMTTSGNKGEVLMVNDVSRVFFHAKARRDLYVQIAKEDQQPGDEKRCDKLNFPCMGHGMPPRIGQTSALKC